MLLILFLFQCYVSDVQIIAFTGHSPSGHKLLAYSKRRSTCSWKYLREQSVTNADEEFDT